MLSLLRNSRICRRLVTTELENRRPKMPHKNTVKAAMIAIGDELLSGRTKDKNIAHLATFLTVKGIDLCEVRIVADDPDAIVEAVNCLRARNDYVFTSGGIGPTHDDITSDAVAKAFGVGIAYHDEAYALLEEFYKNRKIEYTTARKKMARIPQGAGLIENKVSVAPGFVMENVYVMAGVPSVFNAMILAIEPELKGGAKMLSANVDCQLGEGTIGDPLAQIAIDHPQVSIGSYPRFEDEKYSTQIVIRSRTQGELDVAVEAVNKMLLQLQN